MVQDLKTTQNILRTSTSRLFLGIFAFIIIVGLAIYTFKVYTPYKASPLPQQGKAIISQNTLQEKYGLQVILVAVTGNGGLVDIRLRFTDAAKAKMLLKDAKNIPSLWIPDTKVLLQLSEEAKPQEIEYSDGGSLFLMYPNGSNAVKSGNPVTLIFGDFQVEPILAR